MKLSLRQLLIICAGMIVVGYMICFMTLDYKCAVENENKIYQMSKNVTIEKRILQKMIQNIN